MITCAPLTTCQMCFLLIFSCWYDIQETHSDFTSINPSKTAYITDSNLAYYIYTYIYIILHGIYMAQKVSGPKTATSHCTLANTVLSSSTPAVQNHWHITLNYTANTRILLEGPQWSTLTNSFFFLFSAALICMITQFMNKMIINGSGSLFH